MLTVNIDAPYVRLVTYNFPKTNFTCYIGNAPFAADVQLSYVPEGCEFLDFIKLDQAMKMLAEGSPTTIEEVADSTLKGVLRMLTAGTDRVEPPVCVRVIGHTTVHGPVDCVAATEAWSAWVQLHRV